MTHAEDNDVARFRDVIVLAPKARRVCYEPGEIVGAQSSLYVLRNRVDVTHDTLVIARHAAWPWPEELDDDLRAKRSRALNDARAYRWCDDPREWCEVLGDLTPPAWEEFARLPNSPTGYILRGAKADKSRWSRMYAASAQQARDLAAELRYDTGLGLGGGPVPIVARPYVPLEPVGEMVGGVPMAMEFRLFVLLGDIVAHTFYWPLDDEEEHERLTREFVVPHVAREAIERIEEFGRVPFYALDIARAADGRWIVVEVNDGQRAGLQGIPPSRFYGEMRRCLVGPQGVMRVAPGDGGGIVRTDGMLTGGRR